MDHARSLAHLLTRSPGCTAPGHIRTWASPFWARALWPSLTLPTPSLRHHAQRLELSSLTSIVKVRCAQHLVSIYGCSVIHRFPKSFLNPFLFPGSVILGWWMALLVNFLGSWKSLIFWRGTWMWSLVEGIAGSVLLVRCRLEASPVVKIEHLEELFVDLLTQKNLPFFFLPFYSTPPQTPSL